MSLDHAWGLDHGTWSVLKHIYPQADIPVLQLSIDATLAPSACLELGAQLRALRDEGVLILGSGNVVHNLGRIKWDADAQPYPWAQQFEDEVRGHLLRRDYESLANFAALGPAAQLAIPTPEHFLPLLYVLGAAHPDEPCSIAVAGIELGSISMLSAIVG